MAASVATREYIYLNGAEVAEHLKSVAAASETEAVESTHLDSNGNKSFKPGLKNSTVPLEGSVEYDTTTEDTLADIIETARAAQDKNVLSVSEDAPSAGGNCLMSDGYITNDEINTPLGELINISLSVQNDGRLHRNGEWIAAKMDADTETLNSASLDNTASSANGGVFHAHLILESDSDATAGGTSIALQHSTDDAVWVDLVSAQTPSGTHGAVSATVTGTVNRYLRIQVITDGVAHVVGCFKRT